MLTFEERTRLVEVQDRLIDLFVQHDEASRAEDWDQIRGLETEIHDAMARREEIFRFDSKGEA